jgi:hypothetical protein
MQRTSLLDLMKIGIVSFAFIFGFARLFLNISNGIVPVNLGSPIALAILDLSMLFWVLTISNRLPRVSKSDDQVQVKSAANPLPPIVAARTVAFALAGSRVGALLVGAYLGLALNAFLKIQIVTYSNQAKLALFSALLSLLMILISLWLERKCSPPKPKLAEN